MSNKHAFITVTKDILEKKLKNVSCRDTIALQLNLVYTKKFPQDKELCHHNLKNNTTDWKTHLAEIQLITKANDLVFLGCYKNTIDWMA